MSHLNSDGTIWLARGQKLLGEGPYRGRKIWAIRDRTRMGGVTYDEYFCCVERGFVTKGDSIEELVANLRELTNPEVRAFADLLQAQEVARIQKDFKRRIRTAAAVSAE